MYKATFNQPPPSTAPITTAFTAMLYTATTTTTADMVEHAGEDEQISTVTSKFLPIPVAKMEKKKGIIGMLLFLLLSPFSSHVRDDL